MVTNIGSRRLGFSIPLIIASMDVFYPRVSSRPWGCSGVYKALDAVYESILAILVEKLTGRDQSSSSSAAANSSSASSPSLCARAFSIKPSVTRSGNPTTLSKLPSILSTKIAPTPCIP